MDRAGDKGVTAGAAMTVPTLEARVDKLTEALLYVASEMWAARDRQAVLERLLADGGIAAPTLIDSYCPDDVFAKTLETEREAFITSLLGYLAPGD